MFCAQKVGDNNYRGLDINRETVQEVTTLLQLFPTVVSKRKRHAMETIDEVGE